MSDIIQYQVGSQSAPRPTGFSEVTNPLYPAQRVASRLSHFPSNYDISAESHLTKLLKVLLGDPGVGQLQKRMMLTRLQQYLGSTHLFDIDAFYGPIFGAYRRSEENLLINPYVEQVNGVQWDQTVVRDAAYRTRVEQFAKAVNLGATKTGIEVAVEALLGVDVDVAEGWVKDNFTANKWSNISSSLVTTAEFSYADTDYSSIELDTTAKTVIISGSSAGLQAEFSPLVRGDIFYLDSTATSDGREIWFALSTSPTVVGSTVTLTYFDSDSNGVDGTYTTGSSITRSYATNNERNYSYYGNFPYISLESISVSGLSLARPLSSGSSSSAFIGPVKDRNKIVISPKRSISIEEKRDVIRVLERIKPAGCIIEVVDFAIDSYAEVPVRSVHSDSEHWRIRQIISNSLVNGKSTYSSSDPQVERPFHPWSEYQGEAWSLNLNSPTATTFTSGTFPSNSEKIPSTFVYLPTQKYTSGNTSISFLPEYSLRSIRSILSGRLVSEGVASSNPYDGIRQSGELARSANVSIDGADGHILSEINPLRESVNVSGNRFWITPDRPWWFSGHDVLEVQFSTPEWINYIDVSVSAYPGTVTVQAWDESISSWKNLTSRTINTSSPSSVIARNLNDEFYHPFHVGEDHWRRINTKIDPIYSSSIRFVISRFGEPISGVPHVTRVGNTDFGVWIPRTFPSPVIVNINEESLSENDLESRYLSNGSVINYQDHQRNLSALSLTVCQPPKSVSGNAVDYSMALRGIDIGYRFASLNDLAQNFSHLSDSIVTTRNALNQTVKYYVQRYSAESVLNDYESFWKSAPQPVGHAVVNLYLDSRDAQGDPQVVSGFDIDPITIGSSVNLYWSNSVDGIDFTQGIPSDQSLDPIAVVGNIPRPSTGESLSFPESDIAYIDIDNSSIQWNPTSASWWTGIQFVAKDDSSNFVLSTPLTAGTGYPSGLGEVGISIDSGVIEFWVSDASVSEAISFSEGDTVTITGTCIPNNGEVSLTLIFQVNSGSKTSVSATDTPTVLTFPSKIRIGHPSNDDLAGSVFPATLDHLCIQYGTAPSGFFDSPLSWTRNVLGKDRFSSGPNSLSSISGSVLRLSGSNVSTGIGLTRTPNAWGIVGGPLNIFDQMSWTPVPRDFVLRKGIFKVPPTSASWWKFEFTSLTPEPLEAFFDIDRPIKMMSDANTGASENLGTEWTAQQQTAMSLDSVTRFRDSDPQTYADTYRGVRPPTSAFVSDSIQVAEDMRRDAGFGYNTITWQPNPVARINHTSGFHHYQQETVKHANHLAFFVSVKSIKAIRADYTVNDNTTTYEDSYSDLNNIQQYTLDYLTGAFVSGSDPAPIILTTPLIAESRTFGSVEPVSAVQFASHQTPATQILEDHTFKNPELIDYDFDSTLDWHSVGDGFVYYDQASRCVRVVRDGGITLSIPHGSSGTVLADDPSIGGISSNLVPVSSAGVLNIACRVAVQSELRSPLVIQLIGSDSTTVLTEKEFTPSVNSLWEETHSYVIGTFPSLDESVRVRIVQKQTFQDSWNVHAISLFDDAYLWEFSNDGGATWVPAYQVRNNKDGIVRFVSASNGLKYRFTAFRKNVALSYVKIKPWYAGRVLGSKSYPQRGPNVSIYDDQLPIQEDPDFTDWTDPVPQWWFSRFERIYNSDTDTTLGNIRYLVSTRREVDEDVSITDTVDREFNAFRDGTESIPTADSSTRVVAFTRSVAETIGSPSEESYGYIHSDGIASPPVSDVN